ncbi:uncharacterized protein DUF3107 [Tamaricihabitans halophyticus]|uniref:Uncharacterized protein DUF3107 n=1 Tax=Tamaricihabitans halophyticus TaxID=1262583 RepID=A0A4R2QKJ4_9PSEU|nr:DUF3107 domain-containing protein [Tamaricihabitans halophyticus]TCP49274.1 uncharacterized protein DUF3107 [Tamaricihabitans halophyticus]
MEIKIGVAESPRELVVTSSESVEEIESLVSDALGGKSEMLSLTDDKGRRLLVPASRITFVEIVPTESRRVGFAVGS